MIRAIILDFDGVINNSASTKLGGKRIIGIVRRAGYKIPRGIYRRLKTNWGLYGPKMISLSFNLDIQTAGEIYKEWERIDATQFFPLIPKSKQILKKLKSAGLKLFLLTSRNRENLMAVLDHFKLTDLFDFIQAKDDYRFSKPDPRTFDLSLKELSRFGISAGESIYIGDTTFDFECASAANVGCVNVTTGSHGRSDFLEAGQKKGNIIHSIAELPKWLERHKDLTP